LIVPVLVIYELFNKALRGRGEQDALEVYGLFSQAKARATQFWLVRDICECDYHTVRCFDYLSVMSLLHPEFKMGRYGQHRTRHPLETWRDVLPKLPDLGITRVADLTGLDRLGMPVFGAVRPDEIEGNTVYNGKGLTKQEARTGAVMEVVERHGAEAPPSRLRIGSCAMLSAEGATVLSPDRLAFLEERLRGFSNDTTLDWLLGFDLLSKGNIWVPANLVLLPWRTGLGHGLWIESSNGLASGNTLQEAVCHAIAEVIERDAWTISGILAKFGRNALEHFPILKLNTCPPIVGRLVEKFVESELRLVVRVITSDIGIPTFSACIYETLNESWAAAHGGFGAHPNALVALIRAITEAAQSRITDIHGVRDDLRVQHKVSVHANRVLFSSNDGPRADFDTIPSYKNDDIAQDIQQMLSFLSRRNIHHVIVVDLTRSEIGIPVVRVVTPELEQWCVVHFDPLWMALGRRARSCLA
jgi:YcaO-like protein with predicted kinase domain